jgi:hypothetical protein
MEALTTIPLSEETFTAIIDGFHLPKTILRTLMKKDSQFSGILEGVGPSNIGWKGISESHSLSN